MHVALPMPKVTGEGFYSYQTSPSFEKETLA
jgi:hypothetical protein